MIIVIKSGRPSVFAQDFKDFSEPLDQHLEGCIHEVPPKAVDRVHIWSKFGKGHSYGMETVVQTSFPLIVAMNNWAVPRSSMPLLKLLILIGIVLFLVFLLSLRKPWGRTARRIVGNGFLVCLIAGIIGGAVLVYVILTSLPESSE